MYEVTERMYEVNVRISTGCVSVRASVSGECMRVRV